MNCFQFYIQENLGINVKIDVKISDHLDLTNMICPTYCLVSVAVCFLALLSFKNNLTRLRKHVEIGHVFGKRFCL